MTRRAMARRLLARSVDSFDWLLCPTCKLETAINCFDWRDFFNPRGDICFRGGSHVHCVKCREVSK